MNAAISLMGVAVSCCAGGKIEVVGGSDSRISDGMTPGDGTGTSNTGRDPNISVGMSR